MENSRVLVVPFYGTVKRLNKNMAIVHGYRDQEDSSDCYDISIGLPLFRTPPKIGDTVEVVWLHVGGEYRVPIVRITTNDPAWTFEQHLGCTKEELLEWARNIDV